MTKRVSLEFRAVEAVNHHSKKGSSSFLLFSSPPSSLNLGIFINYVLMHTKNDSKTINDVILPSSYLDRSFVLKVRL